MPDVPANRAAGPGQALSRPSAPDTGQVNQPVAEPPTSAVEVAPTSPAPQQTGRLAAKRGISPLRGEGTPVLAGRHARDQARSATRSEGQQSSIARRRAKARAAARAADQATAEASGSAATADEERAARASAGRRPQPIMPPVPQASRRVLGVHLGQFIAWEAALMGIVAAHRQPLSTLIPVIVIAIALVALTAVRVKGRWLYQWAGIGARYRTRRRRRVAADGEAAQTLLSALSRGGSLRRMTVDQTPIAVLSDETGHTAIIEPIIDAPPTIGGVSRRLPSLTEIMPTADPGDPLVSVQIITHAVGAPSMRDNEDAAALSYAELAGGGRPARRRVWLAVQVLHTADPLSASDIEATLINAVRRVTRRLKKSGFRPRVLGVREAAGDLLSLVRMRESVPGHQGQQIAENWRYWSAGEHLNVTYRLVRWPQSDAGSLSGLLRSFERIPAASVTTAVAGRRVGELIDLEVAVRVSCASAAYAKDADSALRRAAEAAGAQIEEMTGEHVFGTQATVPMGGFAS